MISLFVHAVGRCGLHLCKSLYLSNGAVLFHSDLVYGTEGLKVISRFDIIFTIADHNDYMDHNS